MFSQKRTCKNCVFSELTSCSFGVKVDSSSIGANKPLEPCHKITTNSQEKVFHDMGMAQVFRADLAMYRETNL